LGCGNKQQAWEKERPEIMLRAWPGNLEFERGSGIEVPSVTGIDSVGNDSGVVALVKKVVDAGEKVNVLVDFPFCGEVPDHEGGNGEVLGVVVVAIAVVLERAA
jgi:hypothetical protein